MNLALFISKRLSEGKGNKKKISAIIIQIAQIAVALGIIVSLLTLSIGIGFKKSIKGRLSAFSGNVIVTPYETRNFYESSPIYQPDSLKNQIDSFSKNYRHSYKISNHSLFSLAEKPFQTFQTVIYKSGIIKTDSLYEGVIMKGVGDDFNLSAYEDYLVEGHFPRYTKTTRNDSVVISQRIAQSLNIRSNDCIYMYFIRDNLPVIRKFFVSGLYKTGIKEIDKVFIIGDLLHLRKLNRWTNQEIGSLELYVNDIDQTQTISQKMYDELDLNYYVQSAFDLNPHIVQWVDLFDVNMVVVIGVIFVVVAINIIMALLILILDRTPMIGTLKSLGATNWQIRKVFIYNALFILSKGLLIGNIIALSLMFIQHYFVPIKLDSDFYYVSEVPVYISLFHILLVNFIALLLCLAVLIIPTYIITKISPIKSIRFR